MVSRMTRSFVESHKGSGLGSTVRILSGTYGRLENREKQGYLQQYFQCHLKCPFRGGLTNNPGRSKASPRPSHLQKLTYRNRSSHECLAYEMTALYLSARPSHVRSLYFDFRHVYVLLPCK